MASEAMQALTAQIREQAGALGELDLPGMRAWYDGVGTQTPLGADVKVQEVSAGGVPAEWVSTPDAGNGVVLYLHGGGYVIGSPTSHRELCSRIARASGARVLLLNYRLAPESPFPAAVDDAVKAYRFLLAEGVEPSKIIVSGDSAGGGLTLATLVALRDAGERLPAGGVPLSAWTDLAQTGGTIQSKAEEDPIVTGEMLTGMSATYLNGADNTHPLASPLYADFTGLPPLLLQVGTAETLLDDTRRAAERARAAGVDVKVEEYDGAFHVFQQMGPDTPESQQALESIGSFVRQRTAAGVTA
ncbi:MAG TPA: alpha/beta hydrolase [Dehalococcoidia bacterium]|nr:alpha/beta hydrolase [Dehalococcoidia bacterium]